MSYVLVSAAADIPTTSMFVLANSFDAFLRPLRLSGAYVVMNNGYSRVMALVLDSTPPAEAVSAAQTLKECIVAAQRGEQVTLTMASKQLCCDLDSGLTYSALAALAHPGTTITANSAGSRVLLHALAAGHGHFRALPAFNRDENIEVALEAAYKKCGYQQCVV